MSGSITRCNCIDVLKKLLYYRIICLELTNGGTLQTFLQKAELPLPEPCQRMIIHDIAEGLFYLHHENILHSNLTSSCIYLKGSLQVSICILSLFKTDYCKSRNFRENFIFANGLKRHICYV